MCEGECVGRVFLAFHPMWVPLLNWCCQACIMRRPLAAEPSWSTSLLVIQIRYTIMVTSFVAV